MDPTDTYEAATNLWRRALTNADSTNRERLMEHWAGALIGLQAAVDELRKAWPYLHAYMGEQDDGRFKHALADAEDALAGLLRASEGVTQDSDFAVAFGSLTLEELGDFLDFIVDRDP